ncbi:MAG: tetratricopeptide repeat protein, partial [Clostridia bacterium]|nr:tetratricopeptide repeat protein [Clostridia bacterium]
AKEYYQRAAILNSYLYNGQYNLALIAMIQGELDEAERHLQKALQQEELEPIGYFYLAQIALVKGENDKALNYINLALELDKKLEKKILEQPLFIPIQDKIRIPNEPSRKINITLSKKELDTNKYLEEMYNLVDSLNGGKISSVEDGKQQVKEENQLENEKER